MVCTNNSSYYLYTNQYYWSGSPSGFNSATGSAGEFGVDSAGGLNDSGVIRTGGARPVVSLSSKAKLLGNGTYSNPYTVS